MRIEDLFADFRKLAPLKILLMAGVVIGVAENGPAFAQQKNAAGGNTAVASSEIKVPKPEVLTLIIRSAILTLNDALETGNFTVLRDRGAPAFQARFSAAQLAFIFSDLMQSGVDLTGVAVSPIRLAAAPSLDANNRLRVQGDFPTLKGQHGFDLIFEPVRGKWRITGLSLAPVKGAVRGSEKPTDAKRKTSSPSGSEKHKKTRAK